MNTSVERVESRRELRSGPAVFDPGRGGVNVALVMRRLGGEATALQACGGLTGHA